MHDQSQWAPTAPDDQDDFREDGMGAPPAPEGLALSGGDIVDFSGVKLAVEEVVGDQVRFAGMDALVPIAALPAFGAGEARAGAGFAEIRDELDGIEVPEAKHESEVADLLDRAIREGGQIVGDALAAAGAHADAERQLVVRRLLSEALSRA